MRPDVRHAVFALALSVGAASFALAQTAGTVGGVAASPAAPGTAATSSSVTAGTTAPASATPSAQMPNANRFAPRHSVGPNGTPMPDTANPYEAPSPLTPQSGMTATAQNTVTSGCQAGAAGSATPLPCNQAPL
ncbi:MAG: hypothetical protein JO261_09995, partial [Alphaproteobacteria bacterium]|nr:hypothetical protein [Alphaproteobacteria bacterium]